MERTKHKSLVLILARELASNLASPILVVDPEGTLIYFNEPGEAILGQRFAETGELPAGEWGKLWQPELTTGEPVEIDQIVRVLRGHSPAHWVLCIKAGDGVRRTIDLTTLPLFSSVEEYAGAILIFWEHRERR